MLQRSNLDEVCRKQPHVDPGFIEHNLGDLKAALENRVYVRRLETVQLYNSALDNSPRAVGTRE